MAAVPEAEEKKEAVEQTEKEEVETMTPPILGDASDPPSEREEKLAHSLLAMALGLDERLTWTTTSTKDKLLSIQYTYASEGGDTESAIATVRGKTTIQDFNPKDFWEFCEDSTDEEYDFYFTNDAMCEEATVKKSYRDMCYAKRRMYFEDFKVSSLPDGTPVENPETYSQVAVGLVYSVGEEDPDYFAEDSGHVRGFIQYGGYCFFKKNPEDTQCDFVYIVKVDPKGMLPTWVVNLAAPGQARVCTVVRENIDTVRDILAKRRGVAAGDAAGDKSEAKEAEEAEEPAGDQAADA